MDGLALAHAFNTAWNTHDLEAALTLCTDDVVFESTNPPPDGGRVEGRHAVRSAWEPIFANTHGHFDFEEVFVTADRIVQRWRYDWGSGHVRGVDVMTVREGRIAVKLSYVKG
ncbi:MAG TPA: nuclear transport factor 2 family protein [Micromonosporaceae bacterium]|nr:nuclear transport factor 2 family protein [Micromonosporaceae bacterium]